MYSVNSNRLRPIPTWTLRVLYQCIVQSERKLAAAGVPLPLNAVVARAIADERRARVARSRAQRRAERAPIPAPGPDITLPLMTEEEAMAGEQEMFTLALHFGRAAHEISENNAPEDQARSNADAAAYMMAVLFIGDVAEQCLKQRRACRRAASSGVN